MLKVYSGEEKLVIGYVFFFIKKGNIEGRRLSTRILTNPLYEMEKSAFNPAPELSLCYSKPSRK